MNKKLIIDCEKALPAFENLKLWEKVEENYWFNKIEDWQLFTPALNVYYNMQSNFKVKEEEVFKLKSGHSVIEKYVSFCNKNKIEILGYFYDDLWASIYGKEIIKDRRKVNHEGFYFSKTNNQNYVWILDPVLSVFYYRNRVPIIAIPEKLAHLISLPAFNYYSPVRFNEAEKVL